MRPPAGGRRPPGARPGSGQAFNPALALGFRPVAPVEAVEAVALL